jgi:hypothetical protein
MKAATVIAATLDLVAILALVVGWVMNILALALMLGHNAASTTEIVIRLVGVFVAPFGGFIGWF